MSLLQDPLLSIDQIEWFLDNQAQEKFPGAFLKAAGNLSRQVLEQILFILAFYSRMPQNKYMRGNFRLHMVDHIWLSLQSRNPTSGRTYLEEARDYNQRIRKFARSPRSINKWRREFNELSHFRNPIITATSKEKQIRDFVHRMRDIIDPLDTHLITAAVNEILSNGKILASIRNDPPYNPAITFDSVVKPEDLSYVNGKMTFKGRAHHMQVVPADREVSLLKWKQRPIVVQNSVGISIGMRFVTEEGQVVDMTNIRTMLESLGTTTMYQERIKRHLKKFGLRVEF